MVTRITTRISVAKRAGRTKGAVYRSPRIYLPTKLTEDSAFPFREGEAVVVRVRGDRMIIEKARNRGKSRRRDKRTK